MLRRQTFLMDRKIKNISRFGERRKEKEKQWNIFSCELLI